ncbi:MAG: nucleotidyltransferase domain-containing protein [Candidatus Thermoplasmatota archaeon]
MKTISSKNIIWKSSTALRLLIFFFENSTKEFYEKQVSNKTKISLGAVNKYLRELANEKFLILEMKGKMKFFRLNREGELVKKLKITYNLSLPIIKSLSNIGKKLGVKVYLYGSIARGEDIEDSDWDIFIIGNTKLENVEKELKTIRAKFNKKIKPMLFTENEWIKMKEKDPAFYERVEKDKIELK